MDTSDKGCCLRIEKLGRTMQYATSCLLSLLFLVLAYSSVTAQEDKITWRQETAHANWQSRDSQGELVYRNKLWIFGGWFNSDEAPPRDVWSSEDGKNWERVESSAPWL